MIHEQRFVLMYRKITLEGIEVHVFLCFLCVETVGAVKAVFTVFYRRRKKSGRWTTLAECQNARLV